MGSPGFAERLTRAVVWFAAVLVGLPAAAAPAQSTLYAFHGTSDGANPEGGVIWGSDNVLYGTADAGGVNANGTIWSLTPPAVAGQSWTFKVLYRLQSGAGGGYPLGLVQDPSGNLYGYALDSGTGGYGIVFELKKPAAANLAWHFETLYSFQGGIDGAYPSGVTLQPDGTLIGTTDQGGGRGQCADPIGGNLVGCGTIYQLSPPAAAGGTWTETVLHRFAGGNDGAVPVGNPLLADGVLYGVTVIGGAGPCTDPGGTPIGCGTVYSLTSTQPGKWDESVAFAFQGGTQGRAPVSGLRVDKAGAFYGVTSTGGIAHVASSNPNGDGIVYRLTQAQGGGFALQVIHKLGGAGDGREPQGGIVVLPDGAIFGTTFLGPDGYFGALFRVSPPTTPGGGWTERVLAKFPSSGGVYPTGLIARPGTGALYGVTLEGGRFDMGTVYSVVP
jgi:hypothetical protein